MPDDHGTFRPFRIFLKDTFENLHTFVWGAIINKYIFDVSKSLFKQRAHATFNALLCIVHWNYDGYFMHINFRI